MFYQKNVSSNINLNFNSAFLQYIILEILHNFSKQDIYYAITWIQ